MSRLTARMYTNTAESSPGLFGLWNGQKRKPGPDRGGHAQPVMVPVMFPDAVWYNTSGEWLGGGDLDGSDVRTIAKGLAEGEVFVIVRKRDLDASGFRCTGDKLEYSALTSLMECMVRPRAVWLVGDEDSHEIVVEGIVMASTKREWASQNLLDD